MLITALMGSPRKQGSTARVVEEIIRGAAERGAQTKIYCLNDMTIKGCQSCHSCTNRSTVTCAIQDDVNEMLQTISESDGVIFGTPVYMASMTGQMKTLVDRLYPFTKADNTSKMGPGKKALWAITQRNPDETRYLPVFETMAFPMRFLGFADCKIFITAGTPSLEHLLLQSEALDKAYHLGGWLADPMAK